MKHWGRGREFVEFPKETAVFVQQIGFSSTGRHLRWLPPKGGEEKNVNKYSANGSCTMAFHWWWICQGVKYYLFTSIDILYLYYDARRDIRWNILWAWRKSWGRILWNYPRAQVILPYILTHVIIPTLSTSKNYTSGIVLPGRALVLELIFRIALAARPHV